MIILATAIILSLSGSDIRGKSEEAVSATDISSAKEAVAVASSEWELNYETLSEEYDHFGKYATKKVEDAGIANVVVSKEGAINTKYVDENDDIAIIPEGFVVSSAKGEKTVNTGLVIYEGTEPVTDDNVAVAQETRNQFVWVPVDDINGFKSKEAEKWKEFWSEPYREFSVSNDPTGEWKEWTAIKNSVAEYQGFYIGRYETGTSSARTASSSVTDVLVQKNKYVYNYVAWGTKTSSEMSDIGKDGAVALSRSLYSTKSVKSTPCYAAQWELVNESLKGANIGVDINSGGYIPELTGSKEEYKTYNIYDMAGNVCEWSMIGYMDWGRIMWGYDADNDVLGTSHQNFVHGVASSNSYLGFRITLYLK